MAYGKYKDLERRTQSDKALNDKAFEISDNPKYDGYQRGLASMVYRFFDKKQKEVLLNPCQIKSNLLINFINQLLENLRKRKVYSFSKDNVWGFGLADMQLISKYNKGIKYLLCVIDWFSRYAWVVPLKDKKGITIVAAFRKILNDSKRKPNKIWLDQGSEFYNSHFKTMLQQNNIEMYSTHNERKSVVAERFVRTLKTKIYDHMTAISKKCLF